MDGRGRLFESLKRILPVRSRRRSVTSRNSASRQRRMPKSAISENVAALTLQERATRLFHRTAFMLARTRRGTGIAATLLLIAASAGYGAARGGHIDEFTAFLIDLRDSAANAAGFRITSIALSGQKQLNREDVLTLAGVTGNTSLLFLDADVARERLQASAWIASATVLKLYPGRLHIEITERTPFALWQENKRVSVIASDGTVLEPYVPRRFTGLPLVVGEGAETQAQAFLKILGRYPELREPMRAAIFVAQRRWNIHLKNGLDIKLPEDNLDQALAEVVKLDHEQKLLSRDITVVDMRLPYQVTVRLSDEAAKAREDAVAKAKKLEKAKHKGEDA
ncbi:MAG TPA: cell division protein FtsQ/DivIB [Xanthobacteraceae bacterium]|jgi:cell division protein FtsQ|nr:cell division protein FtsQ/DivIB [Xanthobacteraceae bacterium]